MSINDVLIYSYVNYIHHSALIREISLCTSLQLTQKPTTVQGKRETLALLGLYGMCISLFFVKAQESMLKKKKKEYKSQRWYTISWK